MPPTLDGSQRRIRNITINSDDLVPLAATDQTRRMVPATVLNAFAAVIQADDRSAGSGDFCLFSSVLGLLLSGQMNHPPKGETFEGHVLAAVSKPSCCATYSHVIPSAHLDRKRSYLHIHAGLFLFVAEIRLTGSWAALS